MSKKFFTMLNIFFFFFSLPVMAQSFKNCDLNRLLQKHPLMKRFDKETKRFKDTNSEIQKVEDLEQQLFDINTHIEELERQKSEQVAAALTGLDKSNSETDLWKKIKTLDDKILKLKKQLPAINELISTDGVPPIATLLPIARQIVKETLISLNPSPQKIIINKLPGFYLPPPDLRNNPLREFYSNPSNTRKLNNYVKYANSISLLFNQVRQPILINERKNK